MTSELTLALIGVFVLVATSVSALTSWFVSTRSPEYRRLRVLAPTGSGLVMATPSLTGAQAASLPWARWAPPDPKSLSRLQRRLARGGFTTSRAVVVFSVAQVAIPIVLGAAVLLVFGLPGLFGALAAAALGYMAPGLYVNRQTKLRQKAIRHGLPDALDLLTVCVEAGSGLDQAIAKASDELQTSHPALAEEFRAITTEIRAGKARLLAFQSFADRTGLDEVRTLVSMLTQTDRFGTSIGQALRVQSETARTKRRQEAEERAAKLGVKLVFPLVLCLFPALYVVCFGPVVVHVYRVFFVGQ